MVPSLKARGPRCLPARAWRRSLSLLEGAALGRRRFAPPCRARSRAGDSSLASHREHCDPCTQQMRCPWTRLDAEPSAGWCIEVMTCGAVRAGVGMACWPMVRVPSVTRSCRHWVAGYRG